MSIINAQSSWRSSEYISWRRGKRKANEIPVTVMVPLPDQLVHPEDMQNIA